MRWRTGPEGSMTLLPGNRRGLAWALAVVLGLALAGAGTILALRSQIPDPLATHFAPDGANGYESVTTTALLAAAFAAGVGGLLAVLAVVQPGTRRYRRVMLGIGIACAGFISGLFVMMAVTQRGLVDASEATLGAGSYVGPVLVGAILGLWSARLVRE